MSTTKFETSIEKQKKKSTMNSFIRVTKRQKPKMTLFMLDLSYYFSMLLSNLDLDLSEAVDTYLMSIPVFS